MIVSVILSAGPAAKLIPALDSVADHVQAHLVVDTGMSKECRDAIASRVSDVVFVERAWDGNFSSMRNFAFEAASQRDTFERRTGSLMDIMGMPGRYERIEKGKYALFIDEPVNEEEMKIKIANFEKAGVKISSIESIEAVTAPSGAHTEEPIYGLMLDTDERVEWGELSYTKLRALFQENPQVDVWFMQDESGTHVRERFFRLPMNGQFEGPTHEAYVGALNRQNLPHAFMKAVPKTPEEYQEKHKRDVKLLTEHTAKNPQDPRWWYYLGDSRQLAGDLFGAVDAYKKCADLKGWNEESAWACFRAAECLNALGFWHEALEQCLKGMERHPGLAELHWYAGFCCLRGQLWDRALFWSKASVALGCYEGCGKQVVRSGFKNLGGLYDQPFVVMKIALISLGDLPGAAQAEAKRAMAEKARMEAVK